MEKHLTSLDLDRLASAPDRSDAHLAGCEQCRSALASMREYRAVFEREVLPRTLDSVERRIERRRWRWAAPLALVSAVGGLALFLVKPRQAPESDIGVKGGATLKLYAHRGSEVRELKDGELLREGDELRFEVQPGGERFLLIASVDGHGDVEVIHPSGGATSAPIAPNQRFRLPGSIVLDSAPGPERAFAFLSPTPLPASAVTKALAALAAEGPGALRAAQAVPGVQATQLSIHWEKSARPGGP
jgi:hypothetical protein